VLTTEETTMTTKFEQDHSAWCALSKEELNRRCRIYVGAMLVCEQFPLAKPTAADLIWAGETIKAGIVFA
jgi:hypothetical protein